MGQGRNALGRRPFSCSVSILGDRTTSLSWNNFPGSSAALTAVCSEVRCLQLGRHNVEVFKSLNDAISHLLSGIIPLNRVLAGQRNAQAACRRSYRDIDSCLSIVHSSFKSRARKGNNRNPITIHRKLFAESESDQTGDASPTEVTSCRLSYNFNGWCPTFKNDTVLLHCFYYLKLLQTVSGGEEGIRTLDTR